MSITDELRDWAKAFTHWWYDPMKDEYTYTTSTMPPSIDAIRLDNNILAIADRIDAEHERQLEVLYRDMSDAEWVRLSKDADGEYIHVGDVLTDDAEFKSEGKVMRLMLEDDGWMVGLGCGGWSEPSTHEWHHHHEPTVEDVLREFAHIGIRIVAKDGIKAGEFDFYADEEAIAEYAAKLQLRGDAE